MPAMHLISVDLPAPLSPTRAITSPARTSKSTPSSAVTDPKLFETPRVSSLGVAVLAVAGPTLVALTRWTPGRDGRGARPSRAPRPGWRCLAVLLVRADADLGPLELAVLEQQVDVRLRDL